MPTPDDPELTPDLPSSLNAVERALVDTRRSNERRSHWTIAAIFIATSVAVAALVIGLLVRDAFYDFLADRDERSITACEDDNVGRRADQQSALALATPEALARVEQEGGARLQQALDFLHALRPERDCSIEGVRAYYDSDRVEGVLPLDAPDYVLDFLERHRDAP